MNTTHSHTTRPLKVLLLSRYGRTGASSRVRSYIYTSLLAEQGITVVAKPLFSDQYIARINAGEQHLYTRIARWYLARFFLLVTAWRYDLVWIEKELFPWFPATAEVLLNAMGVGYVVDYDDAVFHRYDTHPSRFVRFFLGRKIDRVMKHARAVIVGNEYLAARARQAGADRVLVIPSVVDGGKHRLTQKPKSSSAFRIGWLGSPTTVPHLESALPILRELCAEYSMQLVIVGAEKQTIKNMPVEYRVWSEETETDDVKTFDIGVMPLPDDHWERGKCGYKLIKYMACGLPVVASPVGMNAEIVDEGVNGFLASTPKEWRTAILALYNDPALRTRMGRWGFEKVHERYTIQLMAPRLMALFRSLVG
ncbi:MAG: glycosyltransferase family 4 protein [Candidatus Paceibacterota bacterium]